ncbi:unnamed protein product [Linum trigynum]|uniref:Uncharacterized protein n=1 Tax=Linum trigynum TaxID=586398 RepID=A0AAV2GCI6_9ROSI
MGSSRGLGRSTIWVTRCSSKLVILFNRCRDGTLPRKTCILKKIKGLLTLTQENTLVRASNFNSQKVLQGAEILDAELVIQHSLDVLNESSIITNKDHVVYLD